MRILIAGSSGFLGTALRARLAAAGHQPRRLVRGRPAQGPDEVFWQPSAGALDPATLSDIDVVVNLAGAGVGDRRWTARYKDLLRASRVDSTRTLSAALSAASADGRPRTLVNGCGAHWYGDTGDRAVEEDGPPGEGFLADVCRVWEAATAGAEDAGVRVVRLRTGLVLHRDGGLLKPQLPLFRVGLGGRLGSGRQWMPWISLSDWLSATQFLIDRADLSGPVNMVGPAPARNAEFTDALGRALHRPAVLPVPSLALRAALGDFAADALTSIRALPGVLERAGFAYRHRDLPAALDAALHEAAVATAA